MNLIGQPYPESSDEPEQALDDDGIEERLDSLDARFYDLEASVDVDAILSEQLETGR